MPKCIVHLESVLEFGIIISIRMKNSAEMGDNMTLIKNMPAEDRPYEKCLERGTEVLTDAELLAVILRTGSNGRSSKELAQEVLSLYNVKKGIVSLNHLRLEELLRVKGIGKVKAIQILCIAELSKRMAINKAPALPIMNDPKSVADYFAESLRHKEVEHFYVLLFSTKNQLLKQVEISKGTVNASIVSPREIFEEALRYHAVNIILLHNHPSGDATPSKEDILVTKRIEECGKLLGVNLIDHIIIGDLEYRSLKEMQFI